MKNLPCYITLATFASLALLTVVASLGVPLPFFDIASHIIGYATAAGVAAVFLTDGAPRASRPAAEAKAVTSENVAAPARPRVTIRRSGRPAMDSVPAGAMVAFGAGNDPATVSLM